MNNNKAPKYRLDRFNTYEYETPRCRNVREEWRREFTIPQNGNRKYEYTTAPVYNVQSFRSNGGDSSEEEYSVGGKTVDSSRMFKPSRR